MGLHCITASPFQAKPSLYWNHWQGWLHWEQEVPTSTLPSEFRVGAVKQFSTTGLISKLMKSIPCNFPTNLVCGKNKHLFPCRGKSMQSPYLLLRYNKVCTLAFIPYSSPLVLVILLLVFYSGITLVKPFLHILKGNRNKRLPNATFPIGKRHSQPSEHLVYHWTAKLCYR